MTTEIIGVSIEIDRPPTNPQHSNGNLDPASEASYQLARYAELSGLSFVCVDTVTREVLASTACDVLEMVPLDFGIERLEGEGSAVFELPSGLLFGVLPLASIENRDVVAITYVLSHTNVNPSEIVLAAVEDGWSQDQLDNWKAQQTVASAEFLRNSLDLVFRQVNQESPAEGLQTEIDELTEQIEETYEEISLLHALTQNLQISRGPAELAELCLNRLHGLIKSAGNVIWIEEKNGTPHFLVAGNVPFDEIGMACLVARFEDRDWTHPLVKNRIEGTLLGADFPGLDNLVIVPISEGTHRSGWLLSCNLSEGREFGTIQASLLNSIATILGTHVRNINLYQQHEDLLLCFVQSLVSTLDAKDPYTRGHSDRVALIARQLGEELGLPAEDLHDIYLSGLLHDVGKIGVDDRILRKPGKLTDAEFKEIQKHPKIGYEILQGLKNLQQVLPGVRSHHENYDGAGYPDGLKGDEIPFMARIMAVADSYDAMGSNRPYRQGMPLEKLETIFRNGAGKQWDANIIDCYFRIRDDIKEICDNYSPSDGTLFDTSETLGVSS